jgi:hypothetical protein
MEQPIINRVLLVIQIHELHSLHDEIMHVQLVILGLLLIPEQEMEEVVLIQDYHQHSKVRG